LPAGGCAEFLWPDDRAASTGHWEIALSKSPDTTSPPSLPGFVVAIDRINDLIGRTTAWLMLPVVFLCFIVVVQRYAFGTGRIWMQELFIWTHAAAFMLAAGYALGTGTHVRVDVFYNRASVRFRAWVNIFGVIFFLFLMCLTLLWLAYPQVMMSWRLGERSSSMSGLPYAYILKTFIPVFCIVTILQGISVLARSILVLRGREDLIADPLRSSD
jgi:TRAP-type mannitol/chloroaromatic compound transport system permease small subunit